MPPSSNASPLCASSTTIWSRRGCASTSAGRPRPWPALAPTRGLLPRYVTLPWLPSDAQWQAFVAAARSEPIRNRAMLAFAYDAALRRAELCTLETGIIDPAQRLLRVRAEVAKNHRERVVPYSAATSVLYGAYLQQRRTLSRDRGPLFLSEFAPQPGAADLDLDLVQGGRADSPPAPACRSSLPTRCAICV